MLFDLTVILLNNQEPKSFFSFSFVVHTFDYDFWILNYKLCITAIASLSTKMLDIAICILKPLSLENMYTYSFVQSLLAY